jgi:hypothetical protein
LNGARRLVLSGSKKGRMRVFFELLGMGQGTLSFSKNTQTRF